MAGQSSRKHRDAEPKTGYDQAAYQVVRYCLSLFDNECSRLEKNRQMMTPRWKRFRDRKSLVQRITEWAARIAEGEQTSEIFKEIRKEFGLNSEAGTRPGRRG